MDYVCEFCGGPSFARYEGRYYCPDCFLKECPPDEEKKPAMKYALAGQNAAVRYRRGVLGL